MTIEILEGGITNANFKITAAGKKYVAHFGFPLNKYLGLNRNREIFNTRIAGVLDVGPKVVKFYKPQNLLLLEYLEGRVLDNKFAKQPKMIFNIARTLRKIHYGPKFRGQFDPFKVSKKCFSLVDKYSAWMPKSARGLMDVMRKFRKMFGTMNLSASCHLDLFAPNILWDGRKVRFLDWEYSAVSDYRFDLATLSIMSGFQPHHDRLLLAAYGAKNLDLKPLNIAKAIMLIREIGWDLVQVRFAKLKFNYRKYALDNLQKFWRLYPQL